MAYSAITLYMMLAAVLSFFVKVYSTYCICNILYIYLQSNSMKSYINT